jgi:hypothetical protein
MAATINAKEATNFLDPTRIRQYNPAVDTRRLLLLLLLLLLQSRHHQKMRLSKLRSPHDTQPESPAAADTSSRLPPAARHSTSRRTSTPFPSRHPKALLSSSSSLDAPANKQRAIPRHRSPLRLQSRQQTHQLMSCHFSMTPSSPDTSPKSPARSMPSTLSHFRRHCDSKDLVRQGTCPIVVQHCGPTDLVRQGTHIIVT